MTRLILPAVFFALACSALPKRGTLQDPRGGATMDSIVLERTLCLGTCSAYRLRVTTRNVSFVSRNPGESFSASDAVAAGVADSLMAQARSSGFFALPDSIAGSPLCPDYATDHPTITVTVFGAPTKRVVYYTGCYLLSGDHTNAPSLLALGRFAANIDSLTGARRWIHPAGRR